jgi:hypothetical protein
MKKSIRIRQLPTEVKHILSPRRPGFDPGSVHVGFVVDKLALGQVFHLVRRFSTVNFIPTGLHYKGKRKKKLIIFITGLHNRPQGCGASVASAAGPLKKPTVGVTVSIFADKMLYSFVFSYLFNDIAISKWLSLAIM